MTFAAALAAARRAPDDPERLALLARDALAAGEEDAALALVEPAAARAHDARLWQWAGLLRRAIDDHSRALAAFAEAARSAPDDPGIAHGHARVALEAGIDATALYDRARALAPGNGEVLLGQAAARLAAGDGMGAAAELDVLLVRAPGWVEGHVQLAQLRALLDDPDRATASIDRALASWPADAALWGGYFDLLVRADRYADLGIAAARARAAGHPPALWQDQATIAAIETGDSARADALLAGRDPASLTIWRIRHLLRTARIDQAQALIDQALAAGDGDAIWPYAAIVWRLTGDPRHAWLVDQPGLIRVVDLAGAMPPLDRLAARLVALHRTGGAYLDQSVRGGTQTDGPLFARIDPDIAAVRAAVVAASRDYAAGLPPVDPHHPTLALRRDRRVRFAGSWSVRLAGGGHHTNHVHPQGWISSALYIALPAGTDDAQAQPGWLTIGAPQASLGLAMAPLHTIEPRPGRLILFPSWLWHGTRPFNAGERLTIAFDIAPPR